MAIVVTFVLGRAFTKTEAEAQIPGLRRRDPPSPVSNKGVYEPLAVRALVYGGTPAIN